MSTLGTVRFAYVGSRTTRERNARGEGLSVYRVADDGALSLVHVLGGLVNPSFLALNAAGDRLYTVHGDREEVSVLAVDREGGTLRLLQTQACEGRNPVHLALDPTGRTLVVSNHLSGEVVALPVLEDGRLGLVAQRLAMPGTQGPHRVEQPFSKPHFNGFDPSGRFVLVPDKGLDRIFSVRVDDGRLSIASFAQTREVAGPRHAAFHPGGRFVYVVNELDSTVTAYMLDADDGSLSPLQRLTTLPDEWAGDNRAAAIEIAADGSRLYASNRGHDSVAVYAIGEDGRMRGLGFTSVGRTPRFVTLDPSGRWLYVLEEDDDAIRRFALGPPGAPLEAVGDPVRCGSPVCMVFARGPC